MTDASVREFKMPDVGEGLTEAEILKWYVQPGDTVTDGQVVCEVETAKAAVELPIPYDGVVSELRFPEGTTVDVGTAIIAVRVAGGAPAPVPAQAAAAAPASVQFKIRQETDNLNYFSNQIGGASGAAYDSATRKAMQSQSYNARNSK